MIRAVVTDIEGTTTRLSFVKDVLFPYARARIPEWVRAHPDDADVLAVGGPVDDVIAKLLGWMDVDAKVTPLKSIQGRIWEEGFREGRLLGHVYPDVPVALARWKAQGIVLAVYSSGSVLAQQQLFGHTEYGDLRPYFSAWFDTNVGAKRDTASYVRIAEALGFPPELILFLSDVQGELDAAAAAGFQTRLLEREEGSFANIP